MLDALRFVAPGTPFREGLENVLHAKTGALIVVGCSPQMKNIIDGGFFIDCEFTPAHLYELAKMDGAIIVSEDAKRILYANTQLLPSGAVVSNETGTRHRTADRTARLTNHLVIAISQRRNVITLYQGTQRYVIKDISVILAKTNQALQTLERYKMVLEQGLTNLSALEFEQLVTVHEIVSVMQRIEMVIRIKLEMKKYILELGTEGRLINLQLEELVFNVEQEAELLILDYAKDNKVDTKQVLNEMSKLSPEELMDPSVFLRLLGYINMNKLSDEIVMTRGYRLLSKISRLPSTVICNLICHFGNLHFIMMATIEELDDVEGIGEIRARAIKDGLKRIQEQVFIDRHI
ncbi:DNA integrity scanning protein DisA [Brevibacillus laterosporus]|uniref:Diadenylate cyclase n=1 Tax=Brevibacillus laterosporus LMG 15441 TaxID=1042163 RepID=A0A075R032_BRELA|nr:DNA integrity scanning diadenylate cyclase DisA [Brevibacillus laterosporus]AIG24558.1 diadenylate cyclase [Brevibacillus laterosporus LMG 15441]AUM63205.1 DNA integrity scanning protein DisA [Brevibacillus laterosporus]ERM18405.1 DNA integrity scanning protein DisA [Brevibacillus laterosporus PE36]RJL07403.1 DNA integrity scanning protein DisA [Brevibacillus laterosporus]TPH18457.1 DNA integrity scanning protein DisA [Brevibacillus laterosporus]